MSSMYELSGEGFKPFSDSFNELYPELIKGGDTAVKTVTFNLTENCNLKCSYCYEFDKDRNKKMSKETAKKAIDMLFMEDIKNSSYINPQNSVAIVLEFIGGEPLLEIDLMEYIVEYFLYKAITLDHRWKLYFILAVTTNGVLYNSPKVQRFIKKYKNKLSFTITIDGDKVLQDACRKFTNGEGSYDIVARAYKEHLKVFPDTTTKVTLAPQNIMHLSSAILHIYNEIGIKNIYANPVFENVWSIEHAKILYQELKKLADEIVNSGDKYNDLYLSLFSSIIGKPLPESENRNWCGGTGAMLAFDTDGKVYPCIRYMPFCMGKDEHLKPMDIGDIDKGIGKTPDNEATIKYLKAITRRSQSSDKCFNCPIATGCGWCSACNYLETGSVNKRVLSICDLHKARVLASSYFFNMLRVGQRKNLAVFTINMPKEWTLEIIDNEEYLMLKELEDR